MSLASLFKDIADAIRAKTGSAALITPADFPEAIADIEGADLSGITVTAGDVKSGKKFLNASGELTNGSMTVNAASDVSLAVNGTYTIPAGFHTGSGKVVNSTPVLASQTIYPTTSDQTVNAGQYIGGTQTIHGISASNLSAGNIKKGVTVSVNNGSTNILSVLGTFEEDAKNYLFVQETFTTSDEHFESHQFATYSSQTTVVGVTLPSYKITLDNDATFLMWEAFNLNTLSDPAKQQYLGGFVSDFSRKGSADGTTRAFGSTGVAEVQGESFCLRPDAATINKKVIYVPAEPVIGAANTYKATFVVVW